MKIIRVKVGRLSNILVDSLLFGFEALTRETTLDGAALQVEEMSLTLHCEDCGKEATTDDLMFACPHCGSSSIRILTGNELTVSEIELED